MKDLSFINALPPAKQQAILNGPALTPPPGVKPNFTDPPNLDEVGYGVIISSAIICGSLVILRLYSRWFYHKKIDVEDGAAVAALGALAGFFYCSWMTIIHPGLFVHQWNVQLKDMFMASYYMNVGSTIYGNVIMALKTGILLEWSKTFVPRGFKNSFWWTCHIVLAVNVVFYIICTFVEIFGCEPREKLWKLTLPGKCIDMTRINITSASVNFVSDVIILLLPQKIIWGLHMSVSKKLGVAAIFAVGLFATICAGIRIHSAARFAISDDVMYNAADMGLWCIAEMVGGFLILCLPSLRKMFTESPWIQKILSTVKSSTTSSTGSDLSKGPTPTVGQIARPKPRTADDVLYSGWDRTDGVPLTSVSISTKRSESSERV